MNTDLQPDVMLQGEMPEQPLEPEPLSESVLASILGLCKDTWTQGENELRDSRNRMALEIDAYNQRHPKSVYKNPASSKIHLGLINKTINSAHARLFSSLFPGDSELFTIKPKVNQEGEDLGLSWVEQYIQAILERDGFTSACSDVLKTWLFAEGSLRVEWGGGPDSTIVSFDHVPYQDVIIYPVTERAERAVLAYRTWLTRQELEQLAPMLGYSRLEELKDIQGKELYTPANDAYSNTGQAASTTSTIKKRLGHEIKTFYFPVLRVEGFEAQKVIVTVADDKVVLRLAPNYNFRPIHRGIFRNEMHPQIGVLQTGSGLCRAGYEYEKAANKLSNLGLDREALNTFQPQQFDPNSGFRPDKVLLSPGVFIPVPPAANLQPFFKDANPVPFSLQTVEFFTNKFEESVQVPQFLTGAMDRRPGQDTATAKRLEAEGSDVNFRSFGRRFNQQIVKPAIEQLYVMVQERAKAEAAGAAQGYPTPMLDEMRKVCSFEETGQPLPNFPMLDEIEIDIVAFESVLDKADRTNSFERLAATTMPLAQALPAIADQINIEDLYRNYVQDIGLGKSLNTAQEAEIAAQERQQQAAQEMLMSQMGQIPPQQGAMIA